MNNTNMPKIVNAVAEYKGDIKDLIGYQRITGHLIFDVKLGENFRRKARIVADGHKTKPHIQAHSTVVSRDSVRICLTLAALNDLELLSEDVESAYLSAPCREKVWLKAGPEFGKLEGRTLIVQKALYELKSSGAAFRSFLAETLDEVRLLIPMSGCVSQLNLMARPIMREAYETNRQYYEVQRQQNR